MQRPEWVNSELYPFESRFAQTAHGRMHYVDEGDPKAPPVVLVHGTPSWSFLFRKVIRDLRRDHRVVAMDHLGFGLSEKPQGAPYRPEDHAVRLEALLERLELTDVTLVVHDFGGPIGLSWAVRHPDRVRSLVIMNTWMWGLDGTPAARVSRVMATWFGRFLYTRLNFSPRVLVRAAFADRSRLTPEVHRHYLAPFPDRFHREAPWALARALRESGPWYEELWERRTALADLPALVLWGAEDSLLGPEFLERWREALPTARVREFDDVGHFVPEEADPRSLADEIRDHADGGS